MKLPKPVRELNNISSNKNTNAVIFTCYYIIWQERYAFSNPNPKLNSINFNRIGFGPNSFFRNFPLVIPVPGKERFRQG